VPGHATTVSPLAALATALLIVEKFAVAHEVPAPLGVALGDAYNAGSAAADAAEASASPAPPTATAATPANNRRLIWYPVEIIVSASFQVEHQCSTIFTPGLHFRQGSFADRYRAPNAPG
jgi:hypothetical protein